MYSKLATTAFLILLVLPAFLADEQLPLHRRTARSVGGFFKRIFGRNKQGFQGPFQGTANVPMNTLYNAQQSSYFPNYASFLTQPSEQLNTAASFADYQNQMSPYASSGYSSSNYGALSGANNNQESSLGAQNSPDFSSYVSNYGNLAASPNTQYANYALPSNQMTSVASNSQNVDFHKVLDNFVRSAGLSPNGDHDLAASTNVDQKEPNSNEGTFLNIPYMRKHIKRVSSDSNSQQPPVPSAAGALFDYFKNKRYGDASKLSSQKHLQNAPAALNASFYNPIYGNQLRRLAYYQVQQYAKQNPNAANQLPHEINLINNVHMPTANHQPQNPTPNVMNQATNAYPTFVSPSASNAPPQAPIKQQVNSAPQPASTQTASQFQSVNQLNHQASASSIVNQKQQQQQQQQALIQQAISNPQAFISQYITQQYSQQQQQQQASNNNSNSNLSNNSNKLGESVSSESADLVDENSGSSYYYGQPQVSVSSSTSTKINKQTAHNSPSPSSSAAVSSQQQSNSNASA